MATYRDIPNDNSLWDPLILPHIILYICGLNPISVWHHCVLDCYNIFVIAWTEYILTLNNMWFRQCQGHAISHSWRLGGQGPPPDIPSSPSLPVWAYQVCLAVFPANESNSPQGGDRFTALTLSLPECSSYMGTGLMTWIQSQSLTFSLRWPGTRYTYAPPYAWTWCS